jgi:hypothetical protein
MRSWKTSNARARIRLASRKEWKPVPEQKNPPSPLSPLSPSGQQLSDQSLERLLTAIATALRGTERASLAMHALLLAHGKQLAEIFHRVSTLRVEGATVSDELRTQAVALKALAAAIVDSRQSVDDSRQRLMGATKELAALRQDITGEHGLMAPEEQHGDAPRILRVIVVKLANMGWRHGAKFAGAALGAGGGLKLLWDTIAPLFGAQ